MKGRNVSRLGATAFATLLLAGLAVANAGIGSRSTAGTELDAIRQAELAYRADWGQRQGEHPARLPTGSSPERSKAHENRTAPQRLVKQLLGWWS